MDKKRILEILKMMSNSQGFYGRLLSSITDKQLYALEKMNFKDGLELILYLEGGI